MIFSIPKFNFTIIRVLINRVQSKALSECLRSMYHVACIRSIFKILNVTRKYIGVKGKQNFALIILTEMWYAVFDKVLSEKLTHAYISNCMHYLLSRQKLNI
jgi:hypothetical protein